MTAIVGLEKRRFLFAGVMGTDDYFLEAYVDDIGRRVLIDETNLIEAVKALLMVMPQVLEDEHAIGSALAFIESPIVHVNLRDVTEANAGYGHWMSGIVNPDGSIG